MPIDEARPFIPLSIAVMTVSDTRTLEDDRSGDTLVKRLEDAGHKLADRSIVKDDVDALQNQVKAWVADDTIEAIITTGGTGFTGRDVTPDALEPLFDKRMEGFSVLFHQYSATTVGVSTMQSRAFGGQAGDSFIFCLPGSNGAVKDGWDKVIKAQLDSRHKPCNLVELLPRLGEH